MNDAKSSNAANDIKALSGVNFYSTFNPGLWCALTAFELQRCSRTVFASGRFYIAGIVYICAADAVQYRCFFLYDGAIPLPQYYFMCQSC